MNGIIITIISVVVFFVLVLLVSLIVTRWKNLNRVFWIQGMVVVMVLVTVGFVIFHSKNTAQQNGSNSNDTETGEQDTSTSEHSNSIDTEKDTNSHVKPENDSDESEWNLGFNFEQEIAEPEQWAMISSPEFVETKVLEVEDQESAKKRYINQCRKRNAASCTELALILVGHDDKPKDIVKGVSLLIGTCSINYNYACAELAQLYHDKKIHQYVKAGIVSKQDEEAALKFLKASCSNGLIDACDAVAIAYDKGVGVEKDISSAAIYFKESCDLVKRLPATVKKFPHGCANLADFYARGVGGFARNVKKAEELYQYACEQDLPWACYRLGMLYKSQIGGVKAEKAREALEKASSLGDRAARAVLETL